VKELEFFIQDDAPGVWQMAREKEKEGAIVVDNAAGLFRALRDNTEPGDHVVVKYSGGIVEDCLLHAAQGLLGDQPAVSGVVVDGVIVDMMTSVSFAEQIIPMTTERRRGMFINLLGNRFAQDPRLKVLPESE
jgi:hypothetical protein